MKDPWLTRVASSFSQMVNAVIFCGHQDESLSARCWREDREIYKTIDWFFWLILGEEGHCRNAHHSDMRRAKWLIDQKRGPTWPDVRRVGRY